MIRHVGWRSSWVLCMLGLVAVFAHTAPGAAHDRADRTIRFQPDAAYAHRSVRMVEMGLGPKSYSIFLPAEPTPEARVPLVVFLHGWMGVNPAFYGAWIEHLCRKGSIVVFPRYQSDFGTPPAEFLPNTITAVRDAIDTLATAEHFSRPDLERVAFIGHSAGGNLAAQLAASAAGAGLPRPKAVVAVMPGEVEHQEEPRLSELPAEVLLLVMVGDRDWIVGDQRAREIYLETSRIRPENKEYLHACSARNLRDGYCHGDLTVTLAGGRCGDERAARALG